jgi:peptidoglycan hydrolase-like protein with peptidoglycan-binding domain
MTGVQARLNNLGYNTGPVDGIQGPRTTEAIREFQEKYGLKVDGVVGPITRGKLVEVHRC